MVEIKALHLNYVDSDLKYLIIIFMLIFLRLSLCLFVCLSVPPCVHSKGLIKPPSILNGEFKSQKKCS